VTARDDILARIRQNQPPPVALPARPAAEPTVAADLVASFETALARMGGKVVRGEGDLGAQVSSLHPEARIVCSATREVAGRRRLDTDTAPGSLDDVDVGVVRARFGVAETGSVWLTQEEFGVSALGFLSQHLVVLLDPAAIVPDLHHAYGRRDEFEASYGVFMTGPSATADIEGVLIHGAQGVRSLTVVLAPTRPRFSAPRSAAPKA